jgi:hypothetical protein
LIHELAMLLAYEAIQVPDVRALAVPTPKGEAQGAHWHDSIFVTFIYRKLL